MDLRFESSYELSPILSDLVRNGVVTTHVQFTRTGINVRVHLVQPRPGMGLWPHQSLTPQEAEQLLVSLRGTAGKSLQQLQATAAFSHAARQKKQVDSNEKKSVTSFPDPSLDSLKYMTLNQAKSRIEAFRLDSIERNGIRNILPPASLVQEDLEYGHVSNSMARLIVVTDQIGLPKVKARISSDVTLRVEGAGNLNMWWDGATAEQRLKLLSDNKKLRLNSVLKMPTCVERIGKLPSPFRGNRNGLVLASKEDEFSQEYIIPGSSNEEEEEDELTFPGPQGAGF